MKIGYACLTTWVSGHDYKTITLKNISDEKLEIVIKNNLEVLDKMLDYNIKNKIKMFRITSDLIPFGSSIHNKLDWEVIFKEEFEKMRTKIKQEGIRISMHPGQYTVLNSPHENVIKNSISDLIYHSKVLDLLDEEGRIILHVGGVYGDKESAKKRFVENFKKLPKNVQKKIVIENDDKSYNVNDVLEISKMTKIPVVFDNLHNQLNSSDDDELVLLEKCLKTWIETPKIHYSNQDNLKKNGGHSKRIKTTEFMEFYNKTKHLNFDIMLEVKDKNISAIKCINLINNYDIRDEWAKYKYLIMEKSHINYLKIRKTINENNVQNFYELIDSTLDVEFSEKDFKNALLHVWGYFKKKATEKEKAIFFKYFDEDLVRAKKYLYKLSEKYEEQYLLNSYYFV